MIGTLLAGLTKLTKLSLTSGEEATFVLNTAVSSIVSRLSCLCIEGLADEGTKVRPLILDLCHRS